MPQTNLARRTAEEPGPAWHNHLPGWITATADYHSFKVGLRHTLQKLADAGDLTPAGDIINIRGGAKLRNRIRISRRTFHRHVTRLIQAGFLVVLEQGGPLPGTNAANLYAVPGRPGAFVGDAPGLWRGGVVSKRTYGGVKLTPGWCQNDTTPPQPTYHKASLDKTLCAGTRIAPSHGLIPLPLEDHGVAVRSGRRQRGNEATRQRAKRGLPRFGRETLTDTDWLLGLWAAAVQRGLVAGSDDGRLLFVGMAQHALRVVQRDGGDACRLFASNVNAGRWLVINQADEEAARRRLAAYANATAEGAESPENAERDALQEVWSVE